MRALRLVRGMAGKSGGDDRGEGRWKGKERLSGVSGCRLDLIEIICEGITVRCNGNMISFFY